jgi:S-adenosylmethionine decarboxylase
MQFGTHLTLDGYGGNFEKLFDRDLVEQCLVVLPKLIGMVPLAPPAIHVAPAISELDKGGVVGFVIVTTSHISCHTFPHRGFVSIDVFTCQGEINQDLVVGFFVRAFDLVDTEVNYLRRGTRFPTQDLYVR